MNEEAQGPNIQAFNENPYSHYYSAQNLKAGSPENNEFTAKTAQRIPSVK